MALVSPKKDLSTFLLLTTFALAIPEIAMSQNCSCASNLCCSQFGYCGSSPEYCGQGCREGPCSPVPAASFDGPVPAPSADGESCPGKSFYTGEAFLLARYSFPEFGRTGSVDDGKREIAAFLAHVTHETGNFCYIEEIDGPSKDYCDETNTQYPCNPSKGYYGRGPLQLTWNYNYGAAGQAIGVDGLNAPETFANDPVISFKTALWCWENNVQSVMNQGFGATIRAINGALECNGGNPSAVQSRIRYFTEYCSQFGVSPGDNLTC